MIIGHEGGGVIYTVGDDVTDLKAGDRVTVECVLYCGKCEYCKKGHPSLCDNGGVIGMI